MPKKRTQIPDDLAAEVMFLADMTCCVCRQPRKAVQIHHLDEDPSNHALDNLVVLCLECHNDTQMVGGFGRKTKGPVVRRFREAWYETVRQRRDAEARPARSPSLPALPAPNELGPAVDPAAPMARGGDTEPPELVDFSVEPTVVKTDDGPARITVRARIRDDQSGNAGEGYSSSPSQVSFASASGQRTHAMLSGRELVSGTRLDGVYEYVIELPQYSETGTWRVEHFLLVDQVGNSRTLSAEELERRGLPSAFTNS